MNSFRYQYLKLKLEKEFFEMLSKAVDQSQRIDQSGRAIDSLEDGRVDTWDGGKYDSTESTDRKCKLCFLDDPEIYALIDGLVRFANSKCEWNLDIDYIEPIQYTVYDPGNFYDWHIDESNWTPGKREGNRIRKISFSILLDSEFEGGDFSLQVDGEKRVIELGERNCIFFGSDTPHAVLPVTSGVRRSLVGWAQGPAFK